MATINLDRKEIESKIEAGNNCNGGYILAVAPDGSDHRIHWMETNRQWDPWPEGWLIIGIPALNPDGEGAEWERALELVSNEIGGVAARELEERLSREDVSLIEHVEKTCSEEWLIENEEAIHWLANAFLDACNGDGGDLNDPAPWGHKSEYEGYDPIEPPANFEWA